MRLTDKDGGYREIVLNNNLECIGEKEWKNPLTEKLCQLEDIEDELGIELLTLIKALKDGIYCYSDNGNDILFERIEHFVPYMTKQLHTRGRLSIIHGIKSEEKEKHFAIKDYGKTWSLKKEDFE